MMDKLIGVRKLIGFFVALFSLMATVWTFYFTADAQNADTINALTGMIGPLGYAISGILIVFVGSNAAVHFAKKNNENYK